MVLSNNNYYFNDNYVEMKCLNKPNDRWIRNAEKLFGIILATRSSAYQLVTILAEAFGMLEYFIPPTLVARPDPVTTEIR